MFLARFPRLLPLSIFSAKKISQVTLKREFSMKLIPGLILIDPWTRPTSSLSLSLLSLLLITRPKGMGCKKVIKRTIDFHILFTCVGGSTLIRQEIKVSKQAMLAECQSVAYFPLTSLAIMVLLNKANWSMMDRCRHIRPPVMDRLWACTEAALRG